MSIVVVTLGLEEEGIYRKPGIVSKATKLYKDAIEKGKLNSINLTNEEEFDSKTIASAIKGYLSKQLEQPLLTFALHGQLIDCASKSCENHVIHLVKYSKWGILCRTASIQNHCFHTLYMYICSCIHVHVHG